MTFQMSTQLGTGRVALGWRGAGNTVLQSGPLPFSHLATSEMFLVDTAEGGGVVSSVAIPLPFIF
jgi:hypothetical protein